MDMRRGHALLVLVVLLLLCGCSASTTSPTVSSSPTGPGAQPASAATAVPTIPSIESVYSFQGTDGAWARGSLTRSGSTLFGRTSIGGKANSGTIFSVQTNGSQFKKLFDFPSGGDNVVGNQPHHNFMLLAGQTLVGAALLGGNELGGQLCQKQDPGAPAVDTKGNGTLYTIQVDGTGFNAIKLFDGPPNDTCCAHSPPIFSADGTFLFGLTAGGGANNGGTIYSVNLDGSNFQSLYSFAASSGDQPHGVLTYDSSGTKLLGITSRDGTAKDGKTGAGVVFLFDPSNANYQVLWTFENGDPNNGSTNDHGFLTRIGTALYGTTELGGAFNNGIVFTINEDGTGFQILHSFGPPGDGAKPFGSLTLLNGWLYGTTSVGGANAAGTVFRILPNGTSYQVLGSFSTATTGAFPEDCLTPDATGTILFGQTQAGGTFDPQATTYFGTIFRVNVPLQ